MNNLSLADLEMLLVRLINAKRQGEKIAILVGAGLTMSNLAKSEPGVSSVSEIIEDIKLLFKQHALLDIYAKHVSESASNSEKYQASMSALLSAFGQDELNNVIIRAVLNSMKNKVVHNSAVFEINPASLETEYQNWYLRSGVDSLGEMYVDFNEIFAGPILTSNFDPLLEISIAKHGGNPQSIFLINDGKFLNHKSNRTQSIVHFHGFWHGGDTLHTTDQLKRDRPQLKGDLKRLLNNSVLLVVGYGGWDDVFTHTLLELIQEGNNDFDVLWCFYEDEINQIERNYTYVLNKMSNAIGQRVVLYRNIDCHILFPSFLNKLNSLLETPKTTSFQEKDLVYSVDENIEENNTGGFTCDTPPNNLFWVGREKELAMLERADYRCCFITGFGGQGKSGLASHFIRNIVANDKRYEFWDWRDCKEEDNKFQTILLSQIERLSKGKHRASKLTSESNDDLIHLFFELLANRKIVFVFDNVDNYIDLINSKAIGGVGKLFEEANRIGHCSLFIFTCRPRMVSHSSHFLEISLKELSESETHELFLNYKPPFTDDNIKKLAVKAHRLTNGHALWLTLIAAQAKRGLEVVTVFLDAYDESKNAQKNNPASTLARTTLDVVWKSLNQKQQTLLRGIAELVTSFNKGELENIFQSELSPNQFNRALSALNSLNLLVVKSKTGDEDLFELHPLVKEYILYKFKRSERASFITLIVNFYNQTIVWIKPKLNSDSPLSYFEKYTQKAELQINIDDFKGALSSLQEVGNVIISGGYSEEYIRASLLLFKNINWLKAITEEYPYFNDQFYLFIHSAVERGKFSTVDENLEKYLAVIPGKSFSYLLYCSLRAYYFWFKGEYNFAIQYAEEGLDIKERTGVGDTVELGLHYGLALRDSMVEENLDKALSIFLRGENLEKILDESFPVENFSSVFFGNIGRCLWFKKEYSKAAICYFKSFNLLDEEKVGNIILNIGYASLWIAEYAFHIEAEATGIYFLKFCLINWEKTAPTKAQKVRIDFMTILNLDSNFDMVSGLSSWDVEKFCRQFVKDHMKVLAKR
jgi:hypothetical protein